MKNKKTIKNIILGLVVAVILLGVYAAISGNNEDKALTTGALSSLTGGGGLGKVKETDTSLANAEILRILGSIENITLRDDIFTNPVFRALEDSQFVIPKPVRIGRPNPFLPIGFDAVLASESTIDVSTDQEPGTNFFEEDTTTTFFDENGEPIPEA